MRPFIEFFFLLKIHFHCYANVQAIISLQLIHLLRTPAVTFVLVILLSCILPRQMLQFMRQLRIQNMMPYHRILYLIYLELKSQHFVIVEIEIKKVLSELRDSFKELIQVSPQFNCFNITLPKAINTNAVIRRSCETNRKRISRKFSIKLRRVFLSSRAGVDCFNIIRDKGSFEIGINNK